MDMQVTSHENARIVRVLRALGDENRFHIIQLLLGNDLCVGALARILGISKPAVSQHLRVLREVGLVRGEKISYWTHYRVVNERLREAAGLLHQLIEVRPSNAYICLRQEESETQTERTLLQMCKNRCEQPDNLKTVPEECTPEQVKECHGEGGDHPCEGSCEKPDKLKSKPSQCTPEQIEECHGEGKR